MSNPAREEMLSRIKEALRGASFDALPEPASPDESEQSARRIKKSCDDRRDSLIKRFETELTRVGGRFFAAANAGEACEHVRKLITELGAKSVVGWDSPLFERIALADALEQAGVNFTRGSGELNSDGLTRMAAAEVGITAVDYALADTGTLVLISGKGRARSVSLLPPVHVALLEARQVISGLDDLFPLLRANADFSSGDLASAVTFITGPSRTADIEMTLVMGVHGPQQIYVILLAG